MQVALQLVAIIISIALILLVLLQVKGSGLGDLLGGGGESGGITRTRRGLEKTLFQVTIGLAIAFITVSILAVSFTR
jgi:preprotein translocase subunit SecG